MTSVKQARIAVGDVAETLVPIGKAHHAPGNVYGSAEVFAIEKEKVFKKDWLCIARAEEVANPGDYMTFHLVGEPVVVARNRQGEVHAFSNVCAHRGVEVATGQGNTSEFACPYHGWLYDLDGRLVGAPFMKQSEGFDPAKCRLRPLLCGEWEGWIFINFDPAAASLETFLAEFAADVGHLRMGECRIAHKFTIEWSCNWKFVIENLQDVYHFKTVHAKTFADRVTAADQFKFMLRKRGGNYARYQGASFTPDGKPRLPPMPWLVREPEDYACFGLLSPNFHVLARRDFIRPYFMWPITASTSRAVVYHLFPKDHVESPGFRDKAQIYHDWYQDIVKEDVPVVQTLQQITESDWFQAERMSAMETPIHHFITKHIERLLA